jgi:NADPH:quinone reductase-like Zn-dependent oxidoreductase
MQAVAFERMGEPEDVLAVVDAPAPEPGPGQVLVRVVVRPIHPADFMFIRGAYRVAPRLPQVAGLEGAGVVVAAGEGIDSGWLGRRVAFRSPGAWAELAAVPLTRVYPVPDAIDDAVASQFALNPLTAWGLRDRAAVAPGARVLVTAGRSVVARLVSALFARRGVVTVLIEREGDGFLTRDAATGAVTAAATLPALLGELAARGRYHAILDAVGGPGTLDLIAAAEPGARLITYGRLDDRPFTFRASTLLSRNLFWEGFGIDAYLDGLGPAGLACASDELWALLGEAPELLPTIARHPLAAVGAALRDVRGARTPGKVLLAGPNPRS